MILTFAISAKKAVVHILSKNRISIVEKKYLSILIMYPTEFFC